MSKETKLCLYRLYSKDFDNDKDIDLTENGAVTKNVIIDNCKI